jgi:hypothetical protein
LVRLERALIEMSHNTGANMFLIGILNDLILKRQSVEYNFIMNYVLHMFLYNWSCISLITNSEDEKLLSQN